MSTARGDMGDVGGGGASGVEPPAGFLGWWRRRSAIRRARMEARHLAKEARRILKKKSFRIPGAVAAAVTDAIKGVDDALEAGDVERLRKANATLDDAMDDHLAFARKSTLREYAESIGVAVAVALLLRAFVVEAFQIPSGSMIPTLMVGDHIFVSKFSYGLSIPFTDVKIMQYGQPARGDVIVFKYPLDKSIDYIKRVVALPGDTIEVRQSELYVNGDRVARERIAGPCRYENDSEPDPAAGHQPRLGAGIDGPRDCEKWVETLGRKQHEIQTEPGGGGKEQVRTVVPARHVFVMGDNRDNSSDSRVWGPVNFDLIKGRALIVWWSKGTSENWNFVSWVKAIHWRRFFTVVH
jgi:signal peptidase I